MAEEPVHLALLLPLTGDWAGGQRSAGAAVLAVERVNADKTLLAGRVLEFSWADSGCSARQALAELGGLMKRTGGVDAVIGPGCSSACEVTSYLLAKSTPQISSSCVSPIFSEKTEYELFSRTVSPATSKGPTLIALMQSNNWTKTIMLTSSAPLYMEIGLGLTKQFTDTNIKVLKLAPFKPGYFKGAILSDLKRSGNRIVVFMAYQEARTRTRTKTHTRMREKHGSAQRIWRTHASTRARVRRTPQLLH